MILAERYELLEVLGRGGMGVVHRARDRELDRVVAVKLLPPASAQDPVAVARFEREALAAAALAHPNIVAVFDAGVDGDTRFIVMECVGGRSLDAVLRECGALGAEQAAAVVAQIAGALAAAHRAGIVHRDIKPGNVMVDQTGAVKVLDFGIVRLEGGVTLTQTATVLGSAFYLAPELAHGAEADARSDLYALGCLLYELLTGRPPFTGELPAAILSQHISAAPRPPDELDPAVPAALSELVLRLLAKDPGRRPGDAAEVAAELAAVAAAADPLGATTRVQTLVLPLPGADAAAAAATVPLRRLGRRRQGSHRAASLLSLLLATAVAALFAGLFAGAGVRSAAAGARSRSHGRHRAPARRTHAASTATTATPATTAAAAATTTPVSAPASLPAGPAGTQNAPGQQNGLPGQQNGPGQQNTPPGQQDGGPQGSALPPGQARKLGEGGKEQ